MREFTMISLFDGSGGFPLAAALCGIRPVAASEVEPYPIAVTRSRFPSMKHLGDISKINGGEIEPVDIITFGSPCQDLSVAGKRAGLKHEANGDEETTRSGLFMEAVRIIKEMREKTNGRYPTFALWENVPGAFSSNKGEDFRIVCEELIKIIEPKAVMPAVPKNGWPYADCYSGDGWSLAYRVFDAQYWGVPQRRRRIHLVLDLRGERAREVLFEREGVRGYFAEGRTPWQATAGDAQDCTGADDRAGVGGVIPINTMIATRHKALGRGTGFGVGDSGDPQFTISAGHEHAVAYTLEPGIAAREGGHIYEGVSGTLRAEAGDNRMAVTYPVPNILLDDQGGQQINIRTDDKSPTLRAEAHGNVPCVVEAEGFDMYNQASTGKVSRTLKTPVGGDDHPVVCYSIENHPADSRVSIDESGKVQTLTSRMGTGGGNVPMVMEAVPASFYPQMKVESQCFKQDGVCNTLINGTNPGFQNAVVIPYITPDETPVYCLQGNGIDRADTAGCNGKGWTEDVSYTLNTIDRPAVVFALDRAAFNQGQNAKYEPEITDSGINSTLVARGPSAVAYDESAYALTTGSFMQVTKEVTPTLLARDYKDPTCVAVRYIVRRLTPTECARLQGFADRWGNIDPEDDFTDEEYRFWLDVRNTHAAINGKATKEYTKAQMLTWYNKLHTDSAEYKLWGNGIALPPALYCMQGIADALKVVHHEE